MLSEEDNTTIESNTNESMSRPLNPTSAIPFWNILAINSDAEELSRTIPTLDGIEYLGITTKVLSANYKASVMALLENITDIAVIYLEIGTGNNDIDIDIISEIRKKDPSSLSRIIVCTEEDDLNHVESMLLAYDISGFVVKTKQFTPALTMQMLLALRYYNTLKGLVNFIGQSQIQSIPLTTLGQNAFLESPSTYRVMIVDDEPGIHEITKLSLKRYMAKLDINLEYLDAYSGQEGIEMIDRYPDTAVILLDMVMEHDEAGLDLIRHIREVKQLSKPRIIIRTGQAATLSVPDLVRNYEINDFKSKAELTSLALYTIIQTSLRDYQHVHALELQRNQLSFLSSYDVLTTLPNRRLLHEEVQKMISNAERNDDSFALALVDLDHFKHVNDTLGHSAGDELLIEASTRLQGCLRPTDMLARVGGDEFMVVIHISKNLESSADVAGRLINSMKLPFSVRGQTLHLSASIGLSLYEHGMTVEKMVSEADIAMYEIKQAGRNQFSFFKKEMNERIHKKVQLREKLHDAYYQKNFYLVYQPKAKILDDTIVGVEVLLRAHFPDAEIIGPDQFVPVLESSNLITSITEWQLQEIGIQLKKWALQNPTPLCVAVNFSPYLFRDKAFLSSFPDTLAKVGIDPKYLTIEITEGTFLEDSKVVSQALELFDSMGCSISLDDFGTGYSSISYIRKFPVREIKIDRSFVHNVEVDKSSQQLVSSIVAMVDNLEIPSIVFEGIETKEQLEWLSNKCESGTYQGYLFSKPCSPEQISALIENKELGSSHRELESYK